MMHLETSMKSDGRISVEPIKASVGVQMLRFLHPNRLAQCTGETGSYGNVKNCILRYPC